MTKAVQLNAASAYPDPLAPVGIDVDLDGYLAHYRITQKFHNVEANPIEVVFTFPIPYGAVLLGVEAQIAGQTIASAALPKRQADNRYEDAVAEGNSAVLVQETSPGLYSVNLGNLAPGEDAVLIFSFGQMLEWKGDGIAIRIPTTIAPKYGKPDMREYLVPVVSLDTVRLANLQITVKGGGDKWKVASPTHDLTQAVEQAGLVISPVAETITMDRDIVVHLRGDQFQPSATLVKDGDRFLLSATFQSKLQRHRPNEPRVLKILIDCSGSMRGAAIQQARNGLKAILQSLSPDEHFSITRFGSTVVPVSEDVIVANPASILQAIQIAENMQADLGGTEMRKALLQTFVQPWPTAIASEADVLLITDGESWDAKGIVSIARASGHRVFVIGVGATAAEHLLRPLAEETGGACEIVTPRDGMDEQVLKLFERMDARRMEAIIQWPAGSTEAWPRQLGPVFAGDTVHAFAWYDSKPSGVVEFKAVVGQEVVDHQRLPQFREELSQVGDILCRISAHCLIAGMDDKEHATDLAVRYGLLTAHTNLVMFAERAEKVTIMPELRKVPQMMASGMLGSGRRRCGGAMFDRLHRRGPDPSRNGDDLDIPAFLRKESAPMIFSQDLTLPQRVMVPTSADTFIAAFNEVANHLATIDFSWLQKSGIDQDLCLSFRTLLKGGVTENDLVVIILYRLVSDDVGGRFDRDASRLVRQAVAKIKAAKVPSFDDIQSAITVLAEGNPSWKAILHDLNGGTTANAKAG